jgi:hypothetical protein
MLKNFKCSYVVLIAYELAFMVPPVLIASNLNFRNLGYPNVIHFSMHSEILIPKLAF